MMNKSERGERYKTCPRCFADGGPCLDCKGSGEVLVEDKPADKDDPRLRLINRLPRLI